MGNDPTRTRPPPFAERTPELVARSERLDQILEAGAHVLGERGYHGASMRHVAEASGASLGTLYHYLAGKEDLLYQVQRRILEAAVASAHASLAARGARERLRGLLTDHVRRALALRVEPAVLAGALGRLRGERERRLQALRTEYHEVVQATIEGVLKGAGRSGREAEARVHMLLAMADRLVLEALRGGTRPRPTPLAGRVLRVFLEGVRPR